MSDPLADFVRRGQAAQAAADELTEPRDDSFPYWRIWQTYKHLMGVTYEAVLQKVEFFENSPGDVLQHWLTHGGNANISHVVAVAYMKERARRARVIAKIKAAMTRDDGGDPEFGRAASDIIERAFGRRGDQVR